MNRLLHLIPEQAPSSVAVREVSRGAQELSLIFSYYRHFAHELYHPAEQLKAEYLG
jgi:hypothetical protein